MNDSSGRQGSNALAIIKRFASTRKSIHFIRDIRFAGSNLFPHSILPDELHCY